MKENLFIVEGYHDVMRFKQAIPNINVVSINGSAVDHNIDFILKNQDKYNIVLCFDPDYAGLKLRTYFENKLNKVNHLYIDRDFARSKNNKKIGFEHVELTILKEMLSKYKIYNNNQTSDITPSFLYNMKLIGNINSKLIREELAKHYPIGYTNSKSLLNKLKLLGITKNDIKKVLI